MLSTKLTISTTRVLTVKVAPTSPMLPFMLLSSGVDAMMLLNI